MRASHFVSLFAFVSLVACGGQTSSPAPTGTTGDSGTTPPPGTDSGINTPTAATKFKTHVILGDSISDRGGTGPFYYDLLDKNDDAKYPDYAGKDFDTAYGGIEVVKQSKGGSKAVNLVAQTKALPATLAGPVLVTATIGGNDVQAALYKIISGGDDSPDRADFERYLNDAFTDLTRPDRFGPGVKVKVLITNIYDPSDGTGTFNHADAGRKCPGALGFWPAGRETDPLLEPWNKVMTDTAAKYPDVKVLDLRGRFRGHGVNVKGSWFSSDCIHPAAEGHAQIRSLFWDDAIKL